MLRRVYDAVWGRAFARGYDFFFQKMEKAGLREIRRDLVGEASGRTVEIGAGTGLNLEHYPEAVSELVLTEPDEHMARQLRKKATAGRRRAEVVVAPGERLPFPDDSFDSATMTMVLCTAPDPEAVVAEVARVLKPGGRFLYFEHVRSRHEPRLARWQDRLEKPWRAFGDGCHPNRRTWEVFERSSLEVERAEDGRIPKAVPLVRPMLRGAARKA